MQLYQLKSCPVCGAKVPVSPETEEVSCKFCDNTFEVVRRNGKRDGTPSPGWMEVVKVLPFVMLGVDVLVWLYKRRRR